MSQKRTKLVNYWISGQAQETAGNLKNFNLSCWTKPSVSLVSLCAFILTRGRFEPISPLRWNEKHPFNFRWAVHYTLSSPRYPGETELLPMLLRWHQQQWLFRSWDFSCSLSALPPSLRTKWDVRHSISRPHAAWRKNTIQENSRKSHAKKSFHTGGKGLLG